MVNNLGIPTPCKPFDLSRVASDEDSYTGVPGRAVIGQKSNCIVRNGLIG